MVTLSPSELLSAFAIDEKENAKVKSIIPAIAIDKIFFILAFLALPTFIDQKLLITNHKKTPSNFCVFFVNYFLIYKNRILYVTTIAIVLSRSISKKLKFEN